MMVAFEFERLQVFQEARALRVRFYKLAKLLPQMEHKLATQVRDAARSITNCLAEGHGRYTFKDRIHFCRMSRGSLLELVDDVNLCNDEKYAKPEHLETLRIDCAAFLKHLNGYTKYLREEALKQDNLKRRKPQPSSDSSDP